jgi:hypothetical protein
MWRACLMVWSAGSVQSNLNPHPFAVNLAFLCALLATLLLAANLCHWIAQLLFIFLPCLHRSRAVTIHIAHWNSSVHPALWANTPQILLTYDVSGVCRKKWWRYFGLFRRRDSSVCITTGYELSDRRVGVWVLVGARFFLLRVIQTYSGAHPVSYRMGTGGYFPEGKAAGVWSWPPNSAEVKSKWSSKSTPPYTFMAWV